MYMSSNENTNTAAATAYTSAIIAAVRLEVPRAVVKITDMGGGNVNLIAQNGTDGGYWYHASWDGILADDLEDAYRVALDHGIPFTVWSAANGCECGCGDPDDGYWREYGECVAVSECAAAIVAALRSLAV